MQICLFTSISKLRRALNFLLNLINSNAYDHQN